MITMYVRDGCPNCENAKTVLRQARKKFMVRPMDSDVIVEMLVSGYSGVDAPVIQNGDSFYGFRQYLSR